MISYKLQSQHQAIEKLNKQWQISNWWELPVQDDIMKQEKSTSRLEWID